MNPRDVTLPDPACALRIQGLNKTYAAGVQALGGIDFEVQAGDFFALLGPNGAGKSTTINIICSLTKKTAGRVEVFGYDIDTDWVQAKNQIGIVPQEFNFPIFEKVEDIIMGQAGFYGLPRKLAAERTEKYLKKLDLWHKRHAISRELSGGMKRRLMIARALVHEPKLLILDEPTAGVDIEIRRSMWTFIKEINDSGTTVILTTHYLEEAEALCRHIAIIDQGHLLEHTSMRQLLGRLHTETFILYLEHPLKVLPEIEAVTLRLIDDKTLEVDVSESISMQALFETLAQHGVTVHRLRNKSNRLEELFLQLISKHKV